MASAELSRRVEKLVGYPPLRDMDSGQRREFPRGAAGRSYSDGPWHCALPWRRDTGRAMSQENVEIVRRAWEHWAATGELQAPSDLIWDVSHLGWPDQQIYQGPEGANEFLTEWTDAWDDWEIEVEDYVDAGESVVIIVNQRGRSKATGVPVDMRFAQAWTLRDRRATSMHAYASVDEALEAVGLRD